MNRLRLRGPPERVPRATFLIEEACRTALPASDRLILIRRLELGRSVTAGHQGQRGPALRRAYDEATNGARHGGDDGAAAANCVWFESRAEARRLLLRALLAGRRPAGWFWRLAVPEWQSGSLADWLAQSLPVAAAEGDGGDFLELVALAVEGGAAEAVVEALARNGGTAGTGDRPPPDPPPRQRAGTAGPGGPPPQPALIADPGATLARLRAGLGVSLTASAETLVRRIGPSSRPAALLLERLLVRASPPLSLSRTLLDQLVRAYAQQLSAPAPRRRPEAAPEAVVRAAAEARAVMADRAPPTAKAEGDAAPPEARSSRQRPPPQTPPPRADRPAPQPAPPLAAAPLAELASPAAGLWLVIPSLIRLGWREWLADRPELLATDPGRLLLRTIAAHHRVPPDDPALAPLASAEAEAGCIDIRPPTPLFPPGRAGFEPPAWALLWRTGLDRWLRRRARVGLAHLVWRRGWLRCADDRLVVRFPAAAADIRLRRHALDVDPGWTDWLGLSVRYVFAERPVG